jgi:glutathione S-transferase
LIWNKVLLGSHRQHASKETATMADVEFHSMADSAYLWTAMHVADEKGVSYELIPLVYRSPEHLRLHPFGKMPVLKHGENVIYETLAIAHYLDSAFAGPPLQPASPLGQALMLRWISIVNAYVFPIMNRFMKEELVKPAWGMERDEAFLASAHEPLSLQVRLIDEAVATTPFLAGDHLTLADSFLLPHLLFFTLTKEGAALMAEAPNATRWLDRLRQRQTFAVNALSKVADAMAAAGSRPRAPAQSAV